MNIKDLKYFIAICNNGGFTKASQALFVTQPTITNAINRLESKLNCKLFIRSSFDNNVQLTTAGKTLKYHTERILAELNELNNSLSCINSKKVRLGLPPLISRFLLPEITEKLIKYNLFDYIEFKESSSKDLIQDLENNALDLSVISYIDSNNSFEQLNIHPLKKDIFKLCVGKNHPLSGFDTVSFKDLNNQTFIVLNEHYLDSKILHKLLKANNISAKNVINAGSLTTARALIASGTGVGIMFNFSTSSFKELVTLRTKTELYLTISLAYNKNLTLSDTANNLYSVILNHFNT